MQKCNYVELHQGASLWVTLDEAFICCDRDISKVGSGQPCAVSGYYGLNGRDPMACEAPAKWRSAHESRARELKQCRKKLHLFFV